jgi:hypothetical protein
MANNGIKIFSKLKKVPSLIELVHPSPGHANDHLEPVIAHLPRSLLVIISALPSSIIANRAHKI